MNSDLSDPADYQFEPGWVDIDSSTENDGNTCSRSKGRSKINPNWQKFP